MAGGSGLRAGGDIPKQLQPVAGMPMLWWSLKAFRDQNPDTHLIVVMNPACFDDWDIILSELPEEKRISYQLVCGGRTRTESVSNGLQFIADELLPEFGDEQILVAIHDAARPLVTPDLIGNGWKACLAAGSGVVPVVAVTDSLRRLDSPPADSKDLSRRRSHAVSRKDFVAVQTPQVFDFRRLFDAYSHIDLLDENYTDDASVVEAGGGEINLYQGDYDNMKVTTPSDFAIASMLLQRRKI